MEIDNTGMNGYGYSNKLTETNKIGKHADVHICTVRSFNAAVLKTQD